MNRVVEHLDLLTGLESRETNIRAAIAPESITQSAVTTTTDLALDCEVNFGKVVSVELHRVESTVGRRSLVCIFGFNLFFEAAATVFACSSSLSIGLASFGWKSVSIKDQV